MGVGGLGDEHRLRRPVGCQPNLTPDRETGLGDWTEEMFIATMRTRRHQGKGRPLLPPMPAQIIAALPDEEIKALFAYLQSLQPVRNRVPAPIDPEESRR